MESRECVPGLDERSHSGPEAEFEDALPEQDCPVEPETHPCSKTYTASLESIGERLPSLEQKWMQYLEYLFVALTVHDPQNLQDQCVDDHVKNITDVTELSAMSFPFNSFLMTRWVLGMIAIVFSNFLFVATLTCSELAKAPPSVQEVRFAWGSELNGGRPLGLSRTDFKFGILKSSCPVRYPDSEEAATSDSFTLKFSEQVALDGWFLDVEKQLPPEFKYVSMEALSETGHVLQQFAPPECWHCYRIAAHNFMIQENPIMPGSRLQFSVVHSITDLCGNLVFSVVFLVLCPLFCRYRWHGHVRGVRLVLLAASSSATLVALIMLIADRRLSSTLLLGWARVFFLNSLLAATLWVRALQKVYQHLLWMCGAVDALALAWALRQRAGGSQSYFDLQEGVLCAVLLASGFFCAWYRGNILQQAIAEAMSHAASFDEAFREVEADDSEGLQGLRDCALAWAQKHHARKPLQHGVRSIEHQRRGAGGGLARAELLRAQTISGAKLQPTVHQLYVQAAVCRVLLHSLVEELGSSEQAQALLPRKALASHSNLNDGDAGPVTEAPGHAPVQPPGDPANRSLAWSSLKHPSKAMMTARLLYGGDIASVVDLCHETLLFAPRHLAAFLDALHLSPDATVLRVRASFHAAPSRWDPTLDPIFATGFRGVVVNLRLSSARARELCVDQHVCELVLALAPMARCLSHSESAARQRLRVLLCDGAGATLRSTLAPWLRLPCLTAPRNWTMRARPRAGSAWDAVHDRGDEERRLSVAASRRCSELSSIAIPDASSSLRRLPSLASNATARVAPQQHDEEGDGGERAEAAAAAQPQAARAALAAPPAGRAARTLLRPPSASPYCPATQPDSTHSPSAPPPASGPPGAPCPALPVALPAAAELQVTAEPTAEPTSARASEAGASIASDQEPRQRLPIPPPPSPPSPAHHTAAPAPEAEGTLAPARDAHADDAVPRTRSAPEGPEAVSTLVRTGGGDGAETRRQKRRTWNGVPGGASVQVADESGGQAQPGGKVRESQREARRTRSGGAQDETDSPSLSRTLSSRRRAGSGDPAPRILNIARVASSLQRLLQRLRVERSSSEARDGEGDGEEDPHGWGFLCAALRTNVMAEVIQKNSRLYASSLSNTRLSAFKTSGGHGIRAAMTQRFFRLFLLALGLLSLGVALQASRRLASVQHTASRVRLRAHELRGGGDPSAGKLARLGLMQDGCMVAEQGNLTQQEAGAVWLLDLGRTLSFNGFFWVTARDAPPDLDPVAFVFEAPDAQGGWTVLGSARRFVRLSDEIVWLRGRGARAPPHGRGALVRVDLRPRLAELSFFWTWLAAGASFTLAVVVDAGFGKCLFVCACVLGGLGRLSGFLSVLLLDGALSLAGVLALNLFLIALAIHRFPAYMPEVGAVALVPIWLVIPWVESVLVHGRAKDFQTSWGSLLVGGAFGSLSVLRRAQVWRAKRLVQEDTRRYARLWASVLQSDSEGINQIEAVLKVADDQLRCPAPGTLCQLSYQLPPLADATASLRSSAYVDAVSDAFYAPDPLDTIAVVPPARRHSQDGTGLTPVAGVRSGRWSLGGGRALARRTSMPANMAAALSTLSSPLLALSSRPALWRQRPESGSTLSGPASLSSVSAERATGSRAWKDLHPHARPMPDIDRLYLLAAAVQPLLCAKVEEWGCASEGLCPTRPAPGSADAGPGFVAWSAVRGEGAAAGERPGLRRGALKAPRRAAEKLHRVYSGEVSRLLDLCRDSLVFERATHLATCIGNILADDDVEIVGYKNRLSPDYDASKTCGYRDVVLFVLFKTPPARRLHLDLVICELQLLLKDFALLKNAEGHSRYVQFRDARGE